VLVTQEELATLVGATREAVNQELWRRDPVVDQVHGRVLTQDPLVRRPPVALAEMLAGRRGPSGRPGLPARRPGGDAAAQPAATLLPLSPRWPAASARPRGPGVAGR
jgi:hypothetical protein